MKFKVIKTGTNGANNATDLETKLNIWAEKEKPGSIFAVEVKADNNGYLYAVVAYDSKDA